MRAAKHRKDSFTLLLHEVLPEELIGKDNPLDLTDTNMRARENLKQWRESYAQEMAAQVGAQKLAEGRVEGRFEGRVEGRMEGQRSLVEKQLRLKFGPLPAEASRRLSKATARQLETWAGRVLTATSLAEIWRKPRR